jgi:hypothetical protein
MDLHRRLDWKQVVLAIVALWAFGELITPVQMFVLHHPLSGLLILAGLIVGWLLIRRKRGNDTVPYE